MVPTVILFVLVMARLSGLVEMLTRPCTGTRRPSERQRSEERFGSLVQHASDVVTVVDENGEITFQSPSVKPVLGYERDALIGRSLEELVHEADRDARRRCCSRPPPRTDEPASAAFRWRHQDGSWRDMEATLTNLLDDPTVAGIVLNARDVTEQVRLQAQLTHQAFHDPLTDLANRALFRDRVEHALDRRRRPTSRSRCCSWTSTTSRRSTTASATRPATSCWWTSPSGIRGCVRAGDTAARLGGDEFADPARAQRGRRSRGCRADRQSAGDPVCIDGQGGVRHRQHRDQHQRAGQGRRRRAAAQRRRGHVHRKERAAGARSVVFSPDMHLRALQAPRPRGRAAAGDRARTSCGSTTSRSSSLEDKRRITASRRSCAGHTPSADCWARTSSSRSPRTPG